jgi:hypothetical protein
MLSDTPQGSESGVFAQMNTKEEARDCRLGVIFPEARRDLSHNKKACRRLGRI